MSITDPITRRSALSFPRVDAVAPVACATALSAVVVACGTFVGPNDGAATGSSSDETVYAIDSPAATAGSPASRVDRPTGGTSTGTVSVSVSSASGGSVYLDGRFTGFTTPAVLDLQPGDYLVSVGVEKGRPGYYRRKVRVAGTEPVAVDFTEADRVEARTWNALWYGVPQVTADRGCQTDLSPERLEVWRDDFGKFTDVVEAKSFGTIEWNVEFGVFGHPLKAVNNNRDGGAPAFQVDYERVVEPVLEVPRDLDEIDSIFVFWASTTDSCSIDTTFGGLAYPYSFLGDCYCIRKGNPGVVEVINYLDEEVLANAEQGVWLHEWLHTMTEDFSVYAHMGVPMPIDETAAADDFVVHSFDSFGYTEETEIDFYFDLLQGKVPTVGNDAEFAGLGPEALWSQQPRTYAGQ